MKTVPLKHLVTLNARTLPETTAPDYSFQYIDISQVSRTGDLTIPSEPITFSAAPSRARRLARPRDTVVSTVRTYLRSIATVPEMPCDLVFSTGFAVLSPVSVEPRFLGYLCRSEAFVSEVVARSTGVSYPAINASDLVNIEVPVPSTDEQRRLADFLDDQVARIDQIIAARSQQIALLGLLPWRVFGARLRAAKPTQLPLRRALKHLADGPFGSAFSSGDYAEDGPAVIRLGNIGFANFRSSDLARVPLELFQKFPRSHVRPGDLLIASLGDTQNHAGRACLAPAELGSAMVKGKCYVARSNAVVASNDFLAVLLSSPLGASKLVGQGSGATRSMLNFERLQSTLLPFPELHEQRALTRSFDNERSEAELAAADLTRSISLLTEYKSSLITAAVTGELDVTTASRRIPGE